ncbi:MAG: hypothetical protein ACREDR_38295, partial [Blastocatellia bacterium]
MRHLIESLIITCRTSGIRGIGVFMLAALLAGLTGCTKSQAPAVTPPAPVTVSTVVEKDVPLEIRAIGNVQAYSTVN